MIDFHCHTTCSDGTLSPQELLKLAEFHQVSQLSITDHDTVAAYSVLKPDDIPSSIRLIPGIEFSSFGLSRSIHIVGLNVDLQSDALHAGIEIQQEHRVSRAKRIALKLERCGVANPYEGALEFTSEGNIGRPHFARYLVKAGYCQSLEAAFKQYLGDNKAAFVKQEWPAMDVVIQWILDAGGIPILAHPDHYNMTRSKLCRLTQIFKSYGGVGFEVISGRQRPETTDKLIRIAKEYELYGSIGSDFHSPSQAWLSLGMHPEPENIQGVWSLLN